MPRSPVVFGLQAGFGLRRPESAAICFIKSQFGLSGGLMHHAAGTGFLFRTDRGVARILTAGHNLYNPALRRIARSVTLYFERVGEVYLASREGTSWRVPSHFTQGDAPPEFDFGVVRANMLGTDRFAPIALDSPAAERPSVARLCGYPDEPPVRGARLPYHADIEIFPVGEANFGYRDQPTYVGQSGGPLLAITPDNPMPRAFGLHIRGPHEGQERAVRFSPIVLEGIASIS